MAFKPKVVEENEVQNGSKENPSTILLNGANKLVSEQFGLGDDFTLTKFDNKGNKCILTLASNYFEVTVTVLGNEYYRLIERLGLNDEGDAE